MACHSSGRTMRTRRPRPSEKNALRLFSGLPPEGRLTSERPPRGGTGSARPQGRHRPGPDMSPVGHKPLASSSGEKGMPRHSFSLAMRTHRVRPSEKTTLRVVPWFTPRGLLARLAPLEGRAPPARKGKLALYRAIPPSGNQLPANPSQ